METFKELVNQRIDYLTNVKNAIIAVKIPKTNRPTGKIAFIEFQKDLIEDLEKVIDSEINYQNLELKYYSLREKVKSRQ